jgi:hypothetical protein
MADAKELLSTAFPKRHADAMCGHYQRAVGHFRKGEWEDAIGRVGKLTEAALKAVSLAAGKPAVGGRGFKVDTVIVDLGQLPRGTVDDSLRVLIPRACRFAYDIASNRGGRHDPEEIDPNEMDAAAAIGVSSWILAEMIRFAQKGAVDPAETIAIVAALVERRYPLIETVDGRVYFHKKRKSATDVALVLLAQAYPRRVSKAELIASVRRHGFTAHNARMAVGRLAQQVDDDGAEQLRLLGPGLKRAEDLLQESE